MKTLPDVIREDRERAAVRSRPSDVERTKVTKQIAGILNRNANARVVGGPSQFGFVLDVEGRFFCIQVMPS